MDEILSEMVDDFSDFCDGLDSMMNDMSSEEISDSLMALVFQYAERIRQEVV
jgi:hypothetical protein